MPAEPGTNVEKEGKEAGEVEAGDEPIGDRNGGATRSMSSGKD